MNQSIVADRTFAHVSLGSVWERLGGGEVRRKRGRAFWRNGGGWSVALDFERHLWYDFAQGEGGGVLRLVETALACDRRGALRWLEVSGFLPPSQATALDRRAAALKFAHTKATATDIYHWRIAIVEVLDAQKRKALEASDDTILTYAAARLTGSVLCAKIGLSRSRLSLIERGYIHPAPEELARINTGLVQLIEAKSVIERVAASVGWPTGARHDQ